MSNRTRATVPLLVLDKITAILDVFSLSSPEHSLASIREATNLPASTAQRLVDNLVAHGLLDATTHGYRVGLRMAYWAAPANQGIDVVDMVKPALVALRDELGETAAFFRPSLNYRVCVAIAETKELLHTSMRIGRILPLHAGSAGRVILAWNPELADRLLSTDLPRVSPDTITQASDLAEAIRDTRAQGFAITTGERESGASSLAAPVFNGQADLVGAISVLGPSIRISRETCESWAGRLVEAAETVTRSLGGRHPREA